MNPDHFRIFCHGVRENVCKDPWKLLCGGYTQRFLTCVTGGKLRFRKPAENDMVSTPTEDTEANDGDRIIQC